MTDKFNQLVSLITGCPEDITPEQLADVFNQENDANMALAKESNRTAGWLGHIARFARGKAQAWAKEALNSENSWPPAGQEN